jgi:hypothetical protein
MTKNQINYLVLSDIHLGHRKNPTVEIIANLDLFINQYAKDDLDIIFLAGDVFDRLMEFPSPEISEILLWFQRLMYFCAKNNIILRLLEGTPSHDWKQSKPATNVIRANLPLNVKYIDTLYIEHLEELDLQVLYVPDEWTADPADTYQQVLQLLKDNNLHQVDIAIMHGCFNYQLPSMIKAPKHNEADYLDIVKYYINIGHIHTFSVYERIIAQGSFDRLAHGEEEPKGAVYVSLFKAKPAEFYFIENKKAKIFKTLDIRTRTLENAIKFIETNTANLPLDSYVRLKAKKDHPVFLAFKELELKFSDFHLSKLSDTETDINPYILIDEITIDADYVPITITRDNISDMLIDTIQTKYQLDINKINLAKSMLEELL